MGERVVVGLIVGERVVVGAIVGDRDKVGVTEGVAVEGVGVGYLVGDGDGFFVGARVGALEGEYHLDGLAVG